MKQILCVISVLLIISCNRKNVIVVKEHRGEVSKPAENNDSTNRIIKVGLIEKYNKLPKLKFDSISESEFPKLESIDFIIQPKLEQKSNFFYIQTEIQKHKLKKYMDDGGDKSWNGHEFLGYYPYLKLFAITNNYTSDSMGFGELILIDDKTDYQYKVESFGDGSVELPIPSKNNKYLVYYSNDVYEHKNSDIAVLKINQKTNPTIFLSEYASFHSDDFAVEKIVWLSDNIFFIKGYEEVYQDDKWVKKYKYYKTRFE